MRSTQLETAGKAYSKRPFAPGWAAARRRTFGILCLTLAAAGLTLAAQTDQISTQVANFTTLVNLDGTTGGNPDIKPLIQGTDGNLWGMTTDAGANGGGTVFKMTPNGVLTTVYNLCALPNCTDGNGGVGVVLGTDGNYYGTSGGGTYGFGEVLRITQSGVLTKLTKLHSFDSTDGAGPISHLIQGTDGDFYGTTFAGGNFAGACSGLGCGTVFKMTPSGKLTTLYKFCSQPNCADGAVTYDQVAEGPDGNFYGGAWQGGANNFGVIYKVTSAGVFKVIYDFCSQSNCTDGANPLWLVLGTDGNFYGTTYDGGAYNGGTVFKITPHGALKTLYSFCSQTGCTDGSGPRAGLELGSDGNFYGTTYFGGAGNNNDGTVFEITPEGTLTTLHSFDGTDGANPIGSVGQATNGKFYGTTAFAGPSTDCTGGCGTIFGLSVGLRPFVETVPTSRKVGGTVLILGTNLTGATGVSFNGTPAAFSVASSTLIKTLVPSGATTGFVTVTTPSGTLQSKVKFQVTP
jgi:uncharacterized repeat protein (TIGR03803 family)